MTEIDNILAEFDAQPNKSDDAKLLRTAIAQIIKDRDKWRRDFEAAWAQLRKRHAERVV